MQYKAATYLVICLSICLSIYLSDINTEAAASAYIRNCTLFVSLLQSVSRVASLDTF